MKYLIVFLLLVSFATPSLAQNEDSFLRLKLQLEQYTSQTGKRILILDKDISLLNQPEQVVPITSLPDQLIQGTAYSFFEFNQKYVVIYPSSLREDYLVAQESAAVNTEKKSYPINGIIRDNEMRTTIAGALFSIPQLETATQTDDKGRFELTLPEGTYIAYVSSMGKETERRILKVYGDVSLDITLFESVRELDLVTVSDRAIDANVMSTLPGATRMPLEDLKLLPPLLGEVDVVKSIMLLPGVSTVGEGASGFNVRGGGVDQNLILMDGAPVFNSSHMFGFFSIFNQDAIKDAELFKGDIPAQYGGRMSSVLAINTRAGDTETWYFGGGIGFLSSRLGAHGPIGERTQLMLTARAAYSNWILQRIPNPQIVNSKTEFQDANLRIDHRINDRNTVMLSLYSSSDYFRFGADTAYSWRTNLASLKWNSYFGEKIGSELTMAYSGYRNSILGEALNNEFDLRSSINYLSIQQQLSWEGEKWEGIEAGYQINHYRMGMGDLIPLREETLINPVTIPDEQGIEGAAYLQVPLKFSEKLQGQAGLRYSHFAAIGPRSVYQYEEGEPRTPGSLVDTLQFSSGEVIRQYGGFEPRLALRYAFSDEFSIKGSVNRNLQYLHLLTNNFASAPVDLWKLSDSYLGPQESWQYAMGLYRNLKQNTIEASLELYYKDMPRIVEYLDGAKLFLNPTLETDLVMGEGYAYGSEFLLRKNTGKLNGWVSYTFSRSYRKVDSQSGTEINQGNYFPSNWDQPHDLTIVSSYQPIRRVSFNATFNYRTGRPITLPSGIYDVGGNLVIDYQERNQARIPDYHRMDLGMTYYFYQKKNSKYKSHVTFSVYNVYARRNAFSWFFQPSPESGIPKSYRLAVIGTAIPSVTYNFSFR
uniref:TonB-dependent receptor n=1 Tax=Algoriphagus sp. TaxID=1872435 RepID=UPI00258CD0C6|nr:TonB-dependent receptor [Algoriphagus sp.]